MDDAQKLRLQVFLSHNGFCSRREAMGVVQSGRVTVNGQKISEPSYKVDPEKDVVTVDGKTVHKKSYEYILMNKPSGYMTTTDDPHAEKTVLDLLPENLRNLNPVGRLDKDTEGLLLLTNDGDLAYRLTHPKFNIDKVYFVQISGILQDEQRKRLEQGIKLDGGKTSPARVRNLRVSPSQKTSEFELIIHEGRKRQIRLMVGVLGHRVIYLSRIAQGALTLSGLLPGQWRLLNPQEIQSLLSSNVAPQHKKNSSLNFSKHAKPFSSTTRNRFPSRRSRKDFKGGTTHVNTPRGQ